jgi:hypothetical protein
MMKARKWLGVGVSLLLLIPLAAAAGSMDALKRAAGPDAEQVLPPPPETQGQPAKGRLASGGQDMGELAKPGAALGGKTFALGAGETLTFRTRENQIFGLGQIQAAPAGIVTVQSKVIKPMNPGQFGDKTLTEYRVSVAPGAKAGSTAAIKTSGDWQSRDDPDWAFSFSVKVGLKPPAGP